MKYIKEIFAAMTKELKLVAFVLLVMTPVAALICVPIALAVIYLPDWAFWSLMAAAWAWILFGDAIVGAVRKVNQQRSD